MITSLYAGLLGLQMCLLGLTVSGYRFKHGVSVGDGGKPDLLIAIRRFGNFTEHVPMALLLMLLLELTQSSPTLLHSLGITLLLARIAHQIGLVVDDQPPMWKNALRALGAFPTIGVLLTAAGILLWQAATG